MEKLLKEIHEQTPIPEELDAIVNQAIYKGTHNNAKKTNSYKGMISVAACFTAFIVLLNTNQTFAETLHNIPILNRICEVFTFREYEFEDELKIMNIKIPHISNTGNTELEKRINYHISSIIQEEVDEFEIRVKEWYDAFIQTGGKPEEFMPREIDINYEIKSSNEEYVSFIITKYETTASAYCEQYFYNIDLKSGRELTIKDLIGSSYKEVVTKQIEEQLENLDEERKFYLFDDIVISDLISENTEFFINQDGNLVVVFNKYEIAAGAAGMFEFIIRQWTVNSFGINVLHTFILNKNAAHLQ